MDKKVTLFIAFTVLIFIAGVLSDLRFSDEIMHFWFARDWYELGNRPVYEELIDTHKEVNSYRYYVQAPLWHFSLVLIWKICGGVSKAAAQGYQSGFYVLLIFGTYLLAKEMYGKKAGWYAALVTATTPMFVSFGIMFFVDMPIAALTPFCLYFIIKKRFLWAGVLMGLMFITKRNAYLLFPAFFLLTLQGKALPAISRLKNCLIFCLLVLVITLPDFIFRYKNFGGLLVPGDKGRVVQFAGRAFKEILLPPHVEVLSPKVAKVTPQASKVTSPVIKSISFMPSHISSPSNIPKYLGLSLFVLLAIYIFKFRWLFRKQDLALALPIIIYLPLYAIFFKGWWAVRYLSPTIPLLAILASKTFAAGHKKWLSYLIIALCLVQFAATVAYVSTERRITLDEKEIFDYIKKEVPANSRLLTAEPFLISYNTGWPTVWAATFEEPFVDFFWKDDDGRRREILDKFKINYLLIYKARIYPDQRIRHFGGYPQSFVDVLPILTFFKKVFENDSIVIWEVKRGRI